ncbi:MAG: F0F1 ATP synthase subunit C [Vampirovibrio sp.]|jgi:F-type H+-transporting ATPase subunit c
MGTGQVFTIGGPLAMAIATIGPAIGIGLAAAAFFNATARQPEVRGPLQGVFFATAGLIELMALLGFITLFL